MRIGIDLGGTKIEGVALDGSTEVARTRVNTPRNDYPATVEAIADVVSVLERQGGQSATVGLGIPGTISGTTGLVKNANSVWLIGRPLLADLEARLGRPIRVANDANCFTVSEATDGAAANAAVVFGVILGTGTGGGIVVNGQVLSGVNGVAGEWGHNPLPWPSGEEYPGPQCYCGQRGCVETFLSGPGLRADHYRHTGSQEEPETLAARAAAGDGDAEATLVRYEERLARALAAVINLLDPDVIVVGGGLSNIERIYRSVPHLWQNHVFSCGSPAADWSNDRVATRLVRAYHGDASGVRGAAWLWPSG
jgi:fructokinase